MARYSRHVQDRMSQRSIRKEWVEECLRHADLVVEPAKGLKQFVATVPDGRRLKVVVDTENDIIVTAMWM